MFIGADGGQSRVTFRSSTTVGTLDDDRFVDDAGFLDPTSPIAVDSVGEVAWRERLGTRPVHALADQILHRIGPSKIEIGFALFASAGKNFVQSTASAIVIGCVSAAHAGPTCGRP